MGTSASRISDSFPVLVEPGPSRHVALHRLEPRAVGTPFCESAYSYVQRLSESHRVTLRQLIKFVCASRPGVFEHELPVPSRLDSLCANVAEFISRLAILTGVPEVRLIGLSWLHGRVAWNESIKPGLVWCPACLKAARALHQPVHGQSAWLFVNSRRCLRHDQPLMDACPKCGSRKDSRTSTRPAPLDYCADCGSDLADEATYRTLAADATSVRAWDRCAATQLGELIARAPEILQVRTVPDLERLCQSAIARERVSSKRGLEELAGVGMTFVRLRREKGLLPSVDLLLRLSIAADVSLAGVIAPALWAEGCLDIAVTDVAEQRRRRPCRSHDWVAIEARIQRGMACDEDLSVASLGRELHMRSAPLLAKLGGLGHAVTRYKQARALTELQERAEELAGRIAELHGTHSYFGRRLSFAEASRTFRLTRQSPVLRLAWKIFEESGAYENQHMALFPD